MSSVLNLKITAVVLAKDEEGRIERCLDSLKWCDEVVVVDDYSTDRTVERAQGRGARVFKRKLNGDFAGQRNFGLKKAKGEWVLFVDADEEISSSLSQEIVRRLQKTTNNKTTNFYFKRKDFFINQWLNFGETAQIKLLRLAKKNSGAWEGKVHEVWQVKGKTGLLKEPILHYPHHDITGILGKINFYTDLRAQELAEKGIGVSLFPIIFYPLAKFLKNYLWFLGFRDGLAGLIFALMMSFHSFLVRGKLWQKQKKDGV